MFWGLIVVSVPRGKKYLHAEAVSVCLRARGAAVLLPPEREKKKKRCVQSRDSVCPPAPSHVSLRLREKVTRSRPRFRTAVAEASCPGGGGRIPAPSGRCWACAGSPASSTCGETSSDPEETFNTRVNTTSALTPRAWRAGAGVPSDTSGGYVLERPLTFGLFIMM